MKGTCPSMDINVVFFCPDDDSRTICVGEDFALLGDDEAVTSFEKIVKNRCTIKRMAVLSLGCGYEEPIWMVVDEPHPRHVKLLILELGPSLR